MILQALVEYYQRLLREDSGIAAEGFEQKEIPFLIVLDQHGQFISLQDTREGEGKKKRGRLFTVPKSVKRTRNPSANLLWDNPSYVLGYPEETSKKQHELFEAAIVNRFPPSRRDDGITAVLNFLQNNSFQPIYSHPDWTEISEKGLNLAFKLNTDDGLVCQRSIVIDAITQTSQIRINERPCLVTGEQDTPVTLHTAIKGVHNANPTGANIVSFQKNSGFDSYGKEQGANAPIGKKAEFAYTTALNHLFLRDSTQKFQIGDVTTVFWSEKKNQMENVFQELFDYQPTNQANQQDYRQLLALFRSPETGVEQANLDLSTKFYVLGLAPNAARIAVRFWYAVTVGSVADNIYQHFEDLNMVKSKNEWRRIDLRSLLRSIVLREKDENIAPNLAGDTMKSILAGTPYPQTLLISAIQRCRAEQDVTYTRVALIKAILVRDSRYYKKNVQEVSMSLDTTNTTPGYLLGRLFAVLERTQERASPGINATIRDRFYGAASSTPVIAFPQLMKLKNFHIAKLENKGEAVKLEKLIGEIISKLEARVAFPSHLNIQDQGRFAVGYYHQRQEFFTKKEN